MTVAAYSFTDLITTVLTIAVPPVMQRHCVGHAMQVLVCAANVSTKTPARALMAHGTAHGTLELANFAVYG